MAILTQLTQSPFLLWMFMFGAAMTLAGPHSIRGQLLQPLLDEPQPAENANIEIQAIYNIAEVARSIPDYECIVQRGEVLLSQTVLEADHRYIKSLIAWARNRLAQQHAKNAASMVQMGLLEESQQEYQRAILAYDWVIQHSPAAWRAWMGRAEIHGEFVEYEQALEKYQQVTRLRRSCQAAWFNQAEINRYLRHFSQAIDCYSRVIDQDPTDVQALTGRGHAYLADGQAELAHSDYKMVVNLKPDQEIAICNLVDACRQLGRWEEAIRHLEAAVQLPTASLSLERIANLLATCPDEAYRDPARAMAFATRFMENDHHPEDFLRTASTVFRANGQYEQADEIDQQIMNLDSPLRQATQTVNRKLVK